MRLIVRSELRYLTRTMASTLTSFAGIVLGVASIVAVHLLGEAVNDRLERAALLPGYTHIAHAAGGGSFSESDYFQLRRRWRAGEFAGVMAMVPVIEGFRTSHDGRARHIIGTDPFAVGVPGSLVSASLPTSMARFFTQDLVSATGSTELEMGAEIVFGGSDRRTAKVFSVDAREHGERFLADLPTAQRLLGEEGNLTAIWLNAPDTVDVVFGYLERLFPGVSVAFRRPVRLNLGAGFSVDSAAAWDPTHSFARAIVFNTGALGLLALFVAGFILYQAIHSNVLRRRQEHSRLVAMGVDPVTLRAILVVEGGLLGIAGGIVGILLGWGLAHLLIVEMPSSIPGPSAWVVAKAIGGGLGVGIFGSVVATRKRRSPAARSWRRLAVLFAAGCGLIWGSSEASGIGGAFLAILALCMLQTGLIAPVVGYLLLRVDARRAMFASLGRRATVRSILKNLDEVGIAVAALTIAIAAAIGIGTMVKSFERDFVRLLDQRLWQGHVIEAGGTPADDVARTLAAVDGVEEVRQYASQKMLVHGVRVDVTAANIDAREAARYGATDGIDDGVMLSEIGARRLQRGVGDVLEFGSVSLEIVHIFKDFGAASPRLIVPRQRLGADWPVNRLTTRTNGRIAVQDELRSRFPGIDVQDLADVRRVALDVFSRTFQITSSLMLVALLVAVFGLYNALSALQLRRQAESRLLYHLGVGRRTLVRAGVEQSLFIGAAAALLAIPLGLAIAYLLCDWVNPRAFGWHIELHLSWFEVALPVLGSIAAAGVAGWIPALRTLPAVTGDYSNVVR